MSNFINLRADCQEVLCDKSRTGRDRPWRAKKLANEQLAAAYQDIDESKAGRLHSCSDFLVFSVSENGEKKLKKMNSCRVRLCPICAWRRSLKIHSQMIKILNFLNDDYAYIFLTLTVKNCDGNELSKTLDNMFEAWHNMANLKAFKSAIKGWYRGLEITHNIDKKSPSYNTYHPHFHCVMAVQKSYFNSRDYMTQNDWKNTWKKALKINYEPVVDVRKIKGNNARAVAEAAKYSVKDADYIIPENWTLTLDTVQTLDISLKGRRLIAYGGAFKDAHKRLNLDDEINGDLVNVDGDNTAEIQAHEELYFWNTGYTQYVRII